MKPKAFFSSVLALFVGSICLLVPSGSKGQTCRGITQDSQGFGSRGNRVTIDLSLLTPNTDVDPHPLVSWTHELTANKPRASDFYSFQCTPSCQYYLHQGVSFYELPYLMFGTEVPPGKGALFGFVWYGTGPTCVWYKADLDSFYLARWHTDILLGPFKGNPLVELRKALKPHRQRTLTGITVSVVSYKWSTTTTPPDAPPTAPCFTNLCPSDLWRRAWGAWNSSWARVRITNNTGQVLYYLEGRRGDVLKRGGLEIQEKASEAGWYAYDHDSYWRRFDPCQSFEIEIANPGLEFPAKQAKTQGIAPPTRHLVAFFNTEPVFWDEIQLDITYTPPLRELQEAH